MTPELWKTISALYSELVDLPASEREARLARLAASEPSLHGELVRLLAASPPEGRAMVDNPPLGPLFAPLLHDQRLRSGDVLAERFAIIGHRGSGGMGEVYEAEDGHLRTRVALKLMRNFVAGHDENRARFRREIALARQVTHRNVCRVYDFFPDAALRTGDRVDFLTMELLDGETLSRFLSREAPLKLERALPIIRQIAAGLDAAHRAGVLHRDLKGSNVLLGRDTEGERAVITDFGLARASGGDARLSTASVAGAGTPLFMSPEQMEGAPLGPASDLYSFGVLMYQMATGVLPLQEMTPLQIAARRTKEPARPPSEICPSIDRRWESVILRCLEIDPARRLSSGAEIAGALESSAPALRRPKPRYPWVSSKWVKRAAGVIAAGIVLTAGAYWFFQREALPPEALRWRNQAEQAIENGSHLTARELLDRALAIAPGDTLALTRQAQVLLSLDQQATAQQTLLKAVGERRAGGATGLLREGLRAAATKEWDTALRALEQRHAQAAPADKTSTAMDVVWLLQRAERMPAALQRAQAILAADAAHPAANLAAGRASFRTNRIAEGRRYLERAEQSYRALGNQEGVATRFVEEAEGLFAARRAGDVLAVVERGAAEIEAARRIRQSPGVALLAARLGVVEGQARSELGELDRAVAAARRVVRETRDARLGGTHLIGLLALARVLIVRNLTAEAATLLDETADAARREECERCLGMARYYRGYLASLKGDCPAAEQELAAAIQSLQAAGDQTLVFRARRTVILCQRLAGQLDRAERELAVLEADARRPGAGPDAMIQVLQESGDLATLRGDHERARRHFAALAEALRNTKQFDAEHTIRLQIAQGHLWRGELEDGEKVLDGVAGSLGAEEWPNRDRLEVVRALFEIERGRMPAALARLDRLKDAMRRAQRKGTYWFTEMTCEAAAESEHARRIEEACADHWAGLKKPQSQYDPVRAWYAHSRWVRLKGGPAAEARQSAEKAVEFARRNGHLPNELYALLVLAESAPGDASVQGRLREARARLDDRLGPPGARSFWRRSTYAGRWDRVFKK